MKIKTLHLTSIIIFLLFSLPNFVGGVTDAELEALEQQLEQQETEEIKRIETEKKAKEEAKRKKEAENKVKQEFKRKEVAEKKRQAELARKLREEKKRKLEEENRIRREEKKKQELELKEKYESHLLKAQAYVEDEKYNLAIEEYELLLKSFPEDKKVVDGIEKVKKLQAVCTAVVGKWIVQPNGRTWILNEDNTSYGAWLIFHANGYWECLSAKTREIRTTWPDCAVCATEYLILSDDGNTLLPSRQSGSTAKRVIDN
jgi:hypothetical protein